MKIGMIGMIMTLMLAGGARAAGAVHGAAGHTTTVRDANGVTVITQSGDPD